MELYDVFLAAGQKVSTDSRRVERGSLFFALKGDNFDGNRYAARAIEAGAAMAVVDDPQVAVSDRYIVVADVLETLQQLALCHRQKLGVKIVALTGSNGKTTTKEFLKLALGVKFRISATEGNLNNHIGVPLTLLSFTGDTEIGIVEMGASHCGEIASLCQIARPDVGLITNIGRAHLEGFGGGDGVRRGKGELFDFLAQNGGVALYNTDDEVLLAMASERKGLRAIGYKCDEQHVKLNIFGAYNVKNAAAAIAIAEFMGVQKQAATKAVQAFVPVGNRSEIIKTERGNTIVVDCYNANPSSMDSAIREFLGSNYPCKILILGDMKELGEYAKVEHEKVVQMVGSQRAYYVGDQFVDIGAPGAFTDVEHATEAVREITNATIFLKGSRYVGLERLLDVL